MRPSWCACLLSHACSELISYSLTDPDRDIGNMTPRLSRCHGRVWCVTLEAGPLRALLGHDRLLRLQPCDPCFLLVTHTPPPARLPSHKVQLFSSFLQLDEGRREKLEVRAAFLRFLAIFFLFVAGNERHRGGVCAGAAAAPSFPCLFAPVTTFSEKNA